MGLSAHQGLFGCTSQLAKCRGGLACGIGPAVSLSRSCAGVAANSLDLPSVCPFVRPLGPFSGPAAVSPCMTPARSVSCLRQKAGGRRESACMLPPISLILIRMLLWLRSRVLLVLRLFPIPRLRVSVNCARSPTDATDALLRLDSRHAAHAPPFPAPPPLKPFTPCRLSPVRCPSPPLRQI